MNGRHCIWYKHGDLDDLKSKIDYWIDPARDAEREEIRLLGHQHVKDNYTYVHRMRSLMNKVYGI